MRSPCWRLLTPCWRLPSEVWLLVFGLLGVGDRLRVRAVCKDFRDLVDSCALWRGWTVRLRRNGRCYNKGFWQTLRRWRVSSAVLSSLNNAANIGSNLPALTALILDEDCDAALEGLRCFPKLKRLCLKRRRSLSFERMFSLLPTQLTHLSVCELEKGRMSYSFFLNVSSLASLARLTSLRCLVCHTAFCMDPRDVLPSILRALPGLTHLSVTPPSLSVTPPSLPEVEEPPPLRHRSLVSLEIIDSVCALPQGVMKMLPCLRGLALVFGGDDEDSSLHQKVRVWLKDLPALSSLMVVGGPAVKDFVNSVPSSVSDLTLRPTHINSAEMKAVSERLLLLRHLHLEPSSFLGSDTALVPKFFPKLHSLRVRHERVPEQMFLSLAQLTELKLLETPDPTAPPEELLSKLRHLTKNRVQICQRPKPEQQTCYCVSELPSQTWMNLTH